jgi:hypothetical protein
MFALPGTVRDVRFGSKADIALGPRHVRFTPKSGHWLSAWECPLTRSWRNRSGCFAMLAAMRCGSSLVSSLAAARRPGSSALQQLLYPLRQMHRYALASLLADCGASVRLDWQHVSSVAKRHK